jgi:plasmid stability protein
MQDRKGNNGHGKPRMIHVRLDSETHHKLRVRVAEKDVSIQELVTNLIAEELSRYEIKGGRKSE